MVSQGKWKAKRSGHIEAMTAIMRDAEADDRALTPGEQSRFDAAAKEVEGNDGFCQRAQQLDDVTAHTPTPRTPTASRQLKPAGYDDRGAAIYCLRSDQSMADLPCSVPAESIGNPDATLGNVIRYRITGNPRHLGEYRDMGEGSGPGGAYLVPEWMANSVIQRARAISSVTVAGALMVPMPGETLAMPTIESDVTFNQVGENTSIPATDVGVGSRLLVSKKFASRTPMSRELVEDSPLAPREIEQAIAEAWAARLDTMALSGLGGAELTGIRFHPDVEETAAVGTPTNYAEMLAGWAEILANNVDLSQGAWILAPRDAATFENLTEATTNGYLQPPAAIGALRRLICSHVAITEDGAGHMTGGAESSMYLGDFRQVVYGVRNGNLSIEVSTEGADAFEKHQVQIKAVWRGDMIFKRANHLSRLIGVTA